MALNDLAGMNAARHRRFLLLVDEFDQAWKGFFNPCILRWESLQPGDSDPFPAFAFREEPPATLPRHAVLGLI